MANASAWQQYAIATKRSVGDGDKDGYYYILEAGKDGRPAVRMAQRTRSLAQYFRFIRAGAVRLGTTSTSSDTRPVAFKNADGTHVMIVQADGAQTMTVLGLPAGIYGLRYTTATETGRELPVVAIGSGRPLTAQLPAPGILTVYQKKSP